MSGADPQRGLAPRVFYGPSPYADEPCIALSLAADRFEAAIGADAAAALADLVAARLAYEVAPPAADPLDRARFAAELAREALLYRKGSFTHAAAIRADGTLVPSVGFHDAELSVAALKLVLDLLVSDAARQDPRGTAGRLAALHDAAETRHPDMQASVLIAAARAQGLPVRPLMPGSAGSKLWLYGEGRRGQVMEESLSPRDSTLGYAIQQRKPSARRAMADLGLPVAPGGLARGRADLSALAERLGFPLVTKPPASGIGKGVTTAIASPDALAAGYETAARISGGPVLVERHVTGDEIRLLVLRGRFVAALHRAPARVTGDGLRTVADLVAAENATRRGSVTRRRHLGPIPTGAEMDAALSAQGLAPDSVPAHGATVTVGRSGRRSAGGCPVAVAPVHPDIVAMVETIARRLRIENVGFDLITPDLAADPRRNGCAFLELNTMPSVSTPLSAGWSAADLGAAVFGDALGRIDTTLTISADLPDPDRLGAGLRTGEAAVAGRWIADPGRVWQTTPAPPWAAATVALADPDLSALVVHARAEDIVRHGFPLARIGEIRLACAGLPEPWRAVARRIAGRLTEGVGG